MVLINDTVSPERLKELEEDCEWKSHLYEKNVTERRNMIASALFALMMGLSFDSWRLWLELEKFVIKKDGHHAWRNIIVFAEHGLPNKEYELPSWITSR